MERAIEGIAAECAGRAAREELPGVVGIYRGGHPLYEEAFGLAVRAWSVRNTVDTRFRIASISKMFIAATVVGLMAEGRCSADTSLCDVLPDLRGSFSPAITLHHLLTMTAGIADWFDESGSWDDAWNAAIRQVPIQELRGDRDYLPLFVGRPAFGEPGGAHRYSNSSYILLGMAIEALAGEPVRSRLARSVFDVAGMTRTGFEALDEVAPMIAEGYVPLPGSAAEAERRWRRNTYDVTPAGASDGGAVSTAIDLHRFLEAVRNHVLFDDAATRLLLTPHVDEGSTPLRGYVWKYGYGLYTLLDPADHTVVRYGHTGEEAGCSCRLFHYPRYDVDVVILTNQSDAAGQLGWAIHDVLVASSSPA